MLEIDCSRCVVLPRCTLLCAGLELGMEACQHVSYAAVQHITLLGWQGSVCPSQMLRIAQRGRPISSGQVRGLKHFASKLACRLSSCITLLCHAAGCL